MEAISWALGPQHEGKNRGERLCGSRSWWNVSASISPSTPAWDLARKLANQLR
jgi:hypothetical protein